MRKRLDKEFKKKAVELSYRRSKAIEIAEKPGIEKLYLFIGPFSCIEAESCKVYGN